MKLNDKLTDRLRELPTETMVELLVLAARMNSKFKQELLHRTADPKDLIAAGKRAVRAIGRITAGKKGLSAKAISEKLELIVRQIQSIGRHSPHEGFALVCEILTYEEHIHEEVDDSNGFITDVFRGSLMKAATELSARCTDQKKVLASMSMACKHDAFGTIQYFIDAVGPQLSESVIQTLHEVLSQYPVSDLISDTFRYDDHVEMRKRLCVCTGDIALYIRLCDDEKQYHISDYITLVEMSIDHEDYDNAENWLEALWSLDNHVVEKQANELWLRILKGQVKTEEINRWHRKEFLQRPSKANYDNYATAAGSQKAEDVIAILYEQTTKQTEPSKAAILFLVENGYATEMVTVVSRMLSLNTFFYMTWPQIATAFEGQRVFIGSILIYRRLVEDILDSARAPAYQYAAHYLHHMALLCDRIPEWPTDVANVEEYLTTLHEEHQKKASLWRYFDVTRFVAHYRMKKKFTLP